MGTHLSRGSGATVASALTLLVLVAMLGLAACGGSSTTAPSPSVEPTPVAASSAPPSETPQPTPTHTWTAGAKPIPAMTYPPQPGEKGEGFEPATNGWDFTPTVDIEVTDLGFFDDSQDGLRHAHPVGIFDDDSEKLLVKTTVQPQSPLDGAFRFVKIKPLVLKAGRSYVVASFCRPPYDPEAMDPTGVAWAAEITFGRARERVPSGKLEYPYASQYWFLNANFKFRPLSVASPSP